jgi:hypothetical protein
MVIAGDTAAQGARDRAYARQSTLLVKIVATWTRE